MSQVQIDRGVTRLYENEELRSELNDDEANILLGWGEKQIVEQSMREILDNDFDAWCSQFNQLLVSINQFIGRRQRMTVSNRSAVLSEIVHLIQVAGYSVMPDEWDQYVHNQQSLDNQQSLSELLGLLMSVTPAQPVETQADVIEVQTGDAE